MYTLAEIAFSSIVGCILLCESNEPLTQSDIAVLKTLRNLSDDTKLNTELKTMIGNRLAKEGIA